MNGWTRLGVVASIIWMIGIGGYGHLQIAAGEKQDRDRAFEVTHEACLREQAAAPAGTTGATAAARNCFDEAFQESRAPWRAQERWRAWANAALNLAAIWILVLVTVVAVQWIRAGFGPAKRKEP